VGKEPYFLGGFTFRREETKKGKRKRRRRVAARSILNLHTVPRTIGISKGEMAAKVHVVTFKRTPVSASISC
jgi:hypothetical protein